MKCQLKTNPIALQENIIIGENYRITMLTEALVRLEYSHNHSFEDRASQMVLNRNFSKTNWRMLRNEDGIEIHTPRISIYYNEKEFSVNGLSIKVKGNISAYHSEWRYSEQFESLKGTARTLDMADGITELEEGIVSRNGFAVLDDSGTQVLKEDGWVEPRRKESIDVYFFGYGHSYKEALKDFYYLCGNTPMLPRYALGNWWSRYYQYSEGEYLELMDKFQEKQIPFAVAVIDMDWHLTEIDSKYGSGWTGYTWNKKLFPEPKRFLEKLRDKGMHVTLNVHPADGVRAYEDAYNNMAKEMGVNIENEDAVIFDASSQKFMEAYFKYVHHPLEEEGVDFWWIDWQQGGSSKIAGLDPLWILNHYHFLDNQRHEKRPMTFSRYAGPGSHRYPVGFSGDTITTWESLQFQPYFNTTASNIGYGWWSHDIGGHMMGYKNDEMVARWVQFGVFSPIMRLHSSNSPFNGKEPWRFKSETEDVMSEFLRMRHKLIPYIYTMNYRAYKEGIPLCTPMYYEYPERAEAYEVPNQFFFGNLCIVAPITTPRIINLNVACVNCWMPAGEYYDMYTHTRYRGNRKMDMYRTIHEIPVLIKAGGILTSTDEIDNANACHNPEQLSVQVFTGASGRFTLYEDDNQTCDYLLEKKVETIFEYEEKENVAILKVNAVNNKECYIPDTRKYHIEFIGITYGANTQIQVRNRGEEKSAEVIMNHKDNVMRIVVKDVSVQETLEIQINNYIVKNNPVEQMIFDFLNQAEIEFGMKEKIYDIVLKNEDVGQALSELCSLNMSKELLGVCVEILTAA